DQADVRIRLREVPPRLPVLEGEVLGQQAERVAPGQDALEEVARLVQPADRRQRVDVPERADGEARLRGAEVVRGDVAEQAVRSDQADVRIRLREVPPRLPVLEGEVLGQQAERVAPGQDALEEVARLVQPADRRQRVDVPERADGEARLRGAEVVRGDVAEQAV